MLEVIIIILSFSSSSAKWIYCLYPGNVFVFRSVLDFWAIFLCFSACFVRDFITTLRICQSWANLGDKCELWRAQAHNCKTRWKASKKKSNSTFGEKMERDADGINRERLSLKIWTCLLQTNLVLQQCSISLHLSISWAASMQQQSSSRCKIFIPDQQGPPCL